MLQMTSVGISHRHPLDRLRYRMTLGILVAVILPVILRELVFGTPFTSPTQYNSAIGGALALVLGYMSYRRLHVFPGLAAGGYIFTCFSATFAILATALLLLRLDYARTQFGLSYLISVILFTFIHLRIDAHRKIVLGVIPGGATDTLPQLDNVAWHRLDHPAIALPALQGIVADLHHDHSDAWDAGITRYVLQGTPVYHVKQAVEQLTGRIEVSSLSENTLGSLNPNDVFLKTKGVVDVICAAIGLLFLFPLMVVIGIAIRLDSPGPALFLQMRIGLRAEPFTVYKFRTMRTAAAVIDQNEARNQAMTQVNDPRITRLGGFLRRTRLDELPQLLNILKGEMSLIGPRPEAVALSQWYEREIPFYHYRHIIKPGVTGWAQINQGHVADVSDVKEKLNLDFYYVKNFSLWLDLLIILRTAQTMVTGKGAR